MFGGAGGFGTSFARPNATDSNSPSFGGFGAAASNPFATSSASTATPAFGSSTSSSSGFGGFGLSGSTSTTTALGQSSTSFGQSQQPPQQSSSGFGAFRSSTTTFGSSTSFGSSSGPSFGGFGGGNAPPSSSALQTPMKKTTENPFAAASLSSGASGPAFVPPLPPGPPPPLPSGGPKTKFGQEITTNEKKKKRNARNPFSTDTSEADTADEAPSRMNSKPPKQQLRVKKKQLVPPRSPNLSPAPSPSPMASPVREDDDVTKAELASATNLNGLCIDMCSPKERELHIRVDELSVFEKCGPNVKGTERDLIIKRFQRSSADHKLDIPEEIRPPGVLRRTQLYLEQEIMDREKLGDDVRLQPPRAPELIELYNFCWDRTRMIRKDFILQNYRGAGGRVHPIVLDVHERIARYHILSEHELCEVTSFVAQQNMEQLGQTLKSLNELYDETHKLNDPAFQSPFEAEFRAYFILCTLDNGRGLDVLKFVKGLPKAMLASPQVQFAMQVFVARQTNDYVKFFQLFRHATYLTACLMFRYVPGVRSSALQAMNRAYGKRAPFPLDELVELLCLDDAEHAESVLRQHGLRIIASDENDNSMEETEGPLMVFFGGDFETDVELRRNKNPLQVRASHVYISAKQGELLRRDLCRGVTEYAAEEYPALSHLIQEFEEKERRELYPGHQVIQDEYSSFVDYRATTPSASFSTSVSDEKRRELEAIAQKKAALEREKEQMRKRLEELERKKREQERKKQQEEEAKRQAQAKAQAEAQAKAQREHEALRKQQELEARLREEKRKLELAKQRKQMEEEAKRRAQAEETARQEALCRQQALAEEAERRRREEEARQAAARAKAEQERQRQAMEEEAERNRRAEEQERLRQKREREMAALAAQQKHERRLRKQQLAILNFRFHLWKKYKTEAKQRPPPVERIEFKTRTASDLPINWLFGGNQRLSGTKRSYYSHRTTEEERIKPQFNLLRQDLWKPVDFASIVAAARPQTPWKLVIADLSRDQPSEFGVWCAYKTGVFKPSEDSYQEILHDTESRYNVKLVPRQDVVDGVPVCVRYFSSCFHGAYRPLLAATSTVVLPITSIDLEAPQPWLERVEKLLFDLPITTQADVVVLIYGRHGDVAAEALQQSVFPRLQATFKTSVRHLSYEFVAEPTNTKSAMALGKYLHSILVTINGHLPPAPSIKAWDVRAAVERVTRTISKQHGVSVTAHPCYRQAFAHVKDQLVVHLVEPFAYPAPEFDMMECFPPVGWNQTETIVETIQVLDALATAVLKIDDYERAGINLYESVYNAVTDWIDQLFERRSTRVNTVELKRRVFGILAPLYEQQQQQQQEEQEGQVDDEDSIQWPAIFELVYGSFFETLDGLQVFVDKSWELEWHEANEDSAMLVMQSAAVHSQQSAKPSIRVSWKSLKRSFGAVSPPANDIPTKRQANHQLKRLQQAIDAEKQASTAFQCYLHRQLGRWNDL